MKKTILILSILAVTTSGCGQATKKQTEQNIQNEIETNPMNEEKIKYKSIDISKLWGQERDFFGKIGGNQQKMGIVFLSTVRISETEYEVIGKSKVKNIICDFKGIMEVQNITFEENEGAITGKYRFYEDKNQSKTGEFEGEFVIWWFENYDIYIDVGKSPSSHPDYKGNVSLPLVVEFSGTWKSYNTDATKLTTRWGNSTSVFPGSWNDGQEYFRAENYHSIGWGPFFDRMSNGYQYIESCDEKTREKAEKEYQKLWVNWWK